MSDVIGRPVPVTWLADLVLVSSDDTILISVRPGGRRCFVCMLGRRVIGCRTVVGLLAADVSQCVVFISHTLCYIGCRGPWQFIDNVKRCEHMSTSNESMYLMTMLMKTTCLSVFISVSASLGLFYCLCALDQLVCVIEQD